MSSIIKGIQGEQAAEKKQPEVAVPGYGTMPLDMLQRHVQSLSKEFNDSIQQGEFLKAAYRTEQFYNALMALAKALKQQGVSETTSTGTTAGSAGIGGGAGLGITKSPIEKVIEKPMGESDISGLLAASRLNKSFIVTAQTSEGLKKKFRVKAQSENVAKEKFNRHYSTAKILDVKEEPIDEGQLPPKAGFNKNPHKVGPGTSKDDYEYKKFIPRDRKEKGEEWAIARDVKNVNSKLGKKKPKELDTGFYKNYLGNRPVREEELEEGIPRLQLALYNPDGTTYRQQPMPKMEPDPVDKAKPLSRAKNVPADLSDPDDEIRQKQLKNKLNDIIDNDPGFSDRERFLIKAYWLDGKTFDQLAKETDLSAGFVNQIVRKAERKLRHPERAKHLKPFLLADGEIYSADVAEATGDKEFDDMMKRVLDRKKIKQQAKKDREEQVRAAMSQLIPNTIDTLSIRKKPDVSEEQAPMFTPEEKIVNMNDPRSDGWRVYKVKPAGAKESAIMKGIQRESK
jgi:RNA polymerase sigma factor (sigma-70 family)